MYYWNIKSLKKDLVEGKITEYDSLKYLVIMTIIYTLDAFPLAESSTNQWDIIAFVVIGILDVAGIVYIFSCNGGTKGVHFLQRYLSLGWVTGVRFSVFALPVVIVFLTINAISNLELRTSLSDVIVMGSLMIGYLFIFGRHIKDVART
jgi:hypothetical protein